MQAEQDYRGGLSAEELVGTLQRLLGEERRAMRLICRYLADFADCVEGRGGAGGGGLAGYADVYHAARCLFGVGAHAIRERIRVGRALRSLPRIEEAFLSGELSYSRTREVTRVATAGDESTWIMLGRELAIRALERRVAEAAGRSPRARAVDGVRVGRGSSESSLVTLQLPARTWALLQRAMEGARRESAVSLGDAEALEAVAREALARIEGEAEGEVVFQEENGLESGSVASHSGMSAVSGASGAEGVAAVASGGRRSVRGASHRGRFAVSRASGAGASAPIGASARKAAGGASHPGTAGAPAPVYREGATVAGLGVSDKVPALLAVMGRGGGWSVDALVDATGFPVSDVQVALLGLELDGCIELRWSGDYGMRAGGATGMRAGGG
ncbi:MAG: hypothetical protein R3B70_00085 [Polyangiaceae bacterium]